MSKNNNYVCTLQDNLTSKDNLSNKRGPAKDRNKYTPDVLQTCSRNCLHLKKSVSMSGHATSGS